MLNAQEWLDKNYPKEERKDKEYLNLVGFHEWIFNETRLKGHLDLLGFTNLETLRLGYSEMSSINLRNCSKLKNLYCQQNVLDDLDLSECKELKELMFIYNNKITSLNLENNLNLTTINIRTTHVSSALDIFSSLINLNFLYVGDSNFCGSLKALEKCRQLEKLSIINNKRIVNGLKYLPLNNLKYFDCQGTLFQGILRPYDYDIKAWKLINHPKKSLPENKPELWIEELGKKIRESQITLNEIKQNNPDKTKRIERLESKIIILEEVRRQIIENNELSKVYELKSENQRLKDKIVELEVRLETEEQKVEQIAQIVALPKNY